MKPFYNSLRHYLLQRWQNYSFANLLYYDFTVCAVIIIPIIDFVLAFLEQISINLQATQRATVIGCLGKQQFNNFINTKHC